MKIIITKKQYRSLIDLLHLGDMVVNGIRTGEDTVDEYEELRDYIFSFAKQMGYEDLIELDKKYNKHFETRKYEDGKVQEYLTEYDEEVFWSELSNRLAFRDTGRLNRVSLEDFDREEALKRAWAKEELYNQEFEKNGLENVKVKFQNTSEVVEGE